MPEAASAPLGAYDVVLLDGVLAHGGTGYDVVVQGLAENAARDHSFFLRRLATMRSTE